MTADYTEQDLAANVVKHFEAPGTEIYHEVGGLCDLVVKRGPIIHAIEVKKSWNLVLLYQARRHLAHAHYVSVAVPSVRWSNSTALFQDLCREWGVGILLRLGPHPHDALMHEAIRPRFRRRIGTDLLRALMPEQMDTERFAHAGTNRGGYATAFKLTCKRAEDHVKAFPGCTMHELVEAIDHHYSRDSTARSSLYQWVRAGLLPIQLRNGALYPKTED